MSAEIVVAALGDSITAGSPLWDPDPAVRAKLRPAADERSCFQFWAERVNPRLRFRTSAVYGQRTDEIGLRLDDVVAGASALVVQGGINDIAQGRSVEAAAENLAAIVARGEALGLRVAVADVLPWNNGWPRAEEPIRRLNALVRELGAPVLPFHDTLEDPARPGRLREEWTDDGDHPSVDGYRRLGERAFRVP